MDPRRIDTWMRWEFDKLNANVVTRPRPLRDLLSDPRVSTKDGETVDLDREVLERLASVCSRQEQEHLRLPVTLHFSADVPDSAFLLDELAAEALRRLEGWGEAYPHRDGRTWLPQSLAVDLILRYGGTVQRLFL